MSLDTFVVIELGAGLFAVAYRGFTGKWPWEGM